MSRKLEKEQGWTRTEWTKALGLFASREISEEDHYM